MTSTPRSEPFVVKWTMGERLRKSMTEAGFSVFQIADALGCGRWTVNQWLNDRREPDRRTLIVWALATGVPLEWLETGEVPAQPVPIDEALRESRNLRFDRERER